MVRYPIQQMGQTRERRKASLSGGKHGALHRYGTGCSDLETGPLTSSFGSVVW